MLAIVEDADDDVKKADEAERRVIEELRRLGNEALRSWAAKQEVAQVAAVCEQGEARAHGKKLYWYTTFGKIAVLEHLF